MVQVNLLPDLVLNRRRQAQIRQMATTALVVWFIALAAVTALSLVYEVYQNGQLKTATATYDNLNADVNSSDNVAFRKEALSVQSSLSDLRQLLANQNTMTDTMKLLSSITPKAVQIKDLSITDEGKIEVSVIASSYLEGAKLVTAMKQTKPGTANQAGPNNGAFFDSVVLVGANQADATSVKLEIDALLQKSGGSSK